MSHSIVVAVSGVSGAGKTTIVKQLAKLSNCPYLLFDDNTDTNTYPKDMISWLHNGADVSLINTPKLTSSLYNLKSEDKSRFIFVEEPFGRERTVMSPLIDVVVLLDQPMELCLARIIRRHLESSQEDPIGSITKFLNKYQDHYREIYITVTNQVRKRADLVFEDVLPIQESTDYIFDWLINYENSRF